MQAYKAQLLVIGGGAAGMAAAAAAAEKGIQVVVMEANANVGGNGLFPRGVFAVDSKLQRRKLIFADKDQVFRDCMNYSHWKIDGRIIRALIEKSGDTIDWLTEKGVGFVDVVHHIPNQSPEVFHICSEQENAGSVVMKALKKYCLEKGVTILTKTRGQMLIKEDDGRICGAYGVKEDDEIMVEAQKIIIGTGGFSGNRELIEKYYPNFKFDEVPAGGGLRYPGDGLQMALNVGADVDGHWTMEIAAPKIKGHAPLNLQLGKPYNVWLNAFGRRFADEGIVYNFAMAANAVMRQPKTKTWVLFSEGMLKKTLSDGRDMIELIHIPLDAEEKLEETLVKAEEDGILCKAESAKEVADFIGCEEATVKAEIDAYNAACKAGRDGIFAKKADYMLPLEGTIYAVEAGCDMLITHGGIRVDESFHALNEEQKPLGNLFMAGVDFGGADADVYNVEMSGHGFGFALNSGRIAGEKAAEEILTEGEHEFFVDEIHRMEAEMEKEN
jgi:fumarate reductase flavoprotein subunit